ncbi:11713_t:CDS:2 [Funneliformis mosseae]|uniref:11713_t:CDS:1 n=1 Tax=Funneliformis mosseae TaxID=27381 RepID=A0A9N8VGA2_FUNMO|nr:11713_t:CDS:2 [Funneliformis mosseae]
MNIEQLACGDENEREAGDIPDKDVLSVRFVSTHIHRAVCRRKDYLSWLRVTDWCKM